MSASAGPAAGGGRVPTPAIFLSRLFSPWPQRASPSTGAPTRPPLALAALGAGLAYLGGGSVFG
ncbi:hypothetical protein [Pseudomonas aeruginosa]|uniref:hypothetical protein n=1 Tax=Pseudomonas aeruginosa TaxID=287 RepID=UPI003D2DAA0F